jgi:hypothetical protein
MAGSGPLIGGRQAFSYVPQGAASAFITQQVMRAQAEGGLARSWTVSLNSWQGNLATPGNAGVTRAKLTLAGGGEAGGGAAQEIVRVDYPRAGTTFNVHAVSVTVDVETRMPAVLPAQGMPTFSGWLGVGKANGTDMDATLTEQIRIVADGNGFQETVPPKARAFRVLYLTATHQVGILQNDLSSTGLWATAMVMNPDPGHFLETSMSRWFPLHPDCAFLVLSNNDGAAAVGQWSVQWLLELG